MINKPLRPLIEALNKTNVSKETKASDEQHDNEDDDNIDAAKIWAKKQKQSCVK